MKIEKVLESLSKAYAENIKSVLKANFEEETREAIREALEQNDGEIMTDGEILDIYLRVLREFKRINSKIE